MSFEIGTTPKFERLFKKLPRDVQERVGKKIENLFILRVLHLLTVYLI